jgi:MFS family permease
LIDRTLYNKAFVSVITANMFFWMSVNFFLPVLPIYYHSLGLNDHQVGIAVGVFSLGSLIFRVHSGKAVDRYGSVPVLTVGMLLSVAAILAYHVSTTLATATAARFLHGAGITGYAAAALTMATFIHGPERTTEAVAAYTLFTMIGMGIAASSANWLFALGGMPLVIAAGAAATLLALYLFPRNVRLAVQPSASEPLPLAAIVTSPAVFIPTVSLLAVSLCFGTIMTFLPLHMLSRGVSQFNAFYIAYALAVVFSRLWIGKLCALFAPDRLAFYILAILGATLLTAGQYTAQWVLVLCGAGLGVGYGLAFPVMATIITANITAASRGTAFGFYTTAVDLGFALGAIGMGAVAAAWGYQAVFLAAGGYTALYAVLYRLWLLPKLARTTAAACDLPPL